MEFAADPNVLAEPVAWTARALPDRAYSAALGGIRLHAGRGLTLSGYDHQVSAQATVPVTVIEPGTILVPGRPLAEIVKGLPARPVSVSSDDTRATIRCGTVTFTLLQLPDREYPALPAMPPQAGSVGSELLASAVRQTAIAAARDDALPVLTGIRAEFRGGTLTLAATDKYRLAVRELRWNPANPGINTAIVIPARALADATRTLTSGAGISLAIPPDSGSLNGVLGLEGAGRVATLRLLSGEYPKYQGTLPAEPSPAAAEVAAGPLAEAVKRVALVAERNTPVRLSFTTGHVTLQAGGGDGALATETLEARLEGEDMQIAFNPVYLADGIAALGSDTARINLTSPAKPAVITGTAAGEPAYRYVLMPIRPAG